MRSPRTRVAPALTRALPPSRNRVFTGRHLRLHRQDRDRAHRARQAPHPDPGCQPQGAPPPNFERSAEPKNRACLRFRTDCALAIARSRARRAARSETRARRARRTRPAFSCPYLSVALARAPPPRPRPRGRRRDGSVAPPAKRRRRRLSVSAARERRFRASHLAVARQIFGWRSFGREAQSEKGVFASVPKLWLTPLFSSFSGKNRSCPARSLGTLAS